MSAPYLSIVVPAYNEEKRIGYCAGRLAEYFRKRKKRFEIVVVNDGSRDGTAAATRTAARRSTACSSATPSSSTARGRRTA